MTKYVAYVALSQAIRHYDPTHLLASPPYVLQSPITYRFGHLFCTEQQPATKDHDQG